MADETLSLTPGVLTDIRLSGKPESTFFSSQLERLESDAYPGYILSNIKVYYGDTFSLGRQLVKSRPDYLGKLSVLNYTSDIEIAGG